MHQGFSFQIQVLAFRAGRLSLRTWNCLHVSSLHRPIGFPYYHSAQIIAALRFAEPHLSFSSCYGCRGTDIYTCPTITCMYHFPAREAVRNSNLTTLYMYAYTALRIYNSTRIQLYVYTTRPKMSRSYEVHIPRHFNLTTTPDTPLYKALGMTLGSQVKESGRNLQRPAY